MTIDRTEDPVLCDQLLSQAFADGHGEHQFRRLIEHSAEASRAMTEEKRRAQPNAQRAKAEAHDRRRRGQA